MQGMWVPSLVRELRPHMPKKKKNKPQTQDCIFLSMNMEYLFIKHDYKFFYWIYLTNNIVYIWEVCDTFCYVTFDIFIFCTMIAIVVILTILHNYDTILWSMFIIGYIKITKAYLLLIESLYP